jgi:hypothetical protein
MHVFTDTSGFGDFLTESYSLGVTNNNVFPVDVVLYAECAKLASWSYIRRSDDTV